MNIDVLLGARCVRISLADERIAQSTRRYYAPASTECEDEPELIVNVGTNGVVGHVTGFRRGTWHRYPPAEQLEVALLDLLFELHPGSPVLHAGCVIWRGLPIVFVAPSGSGKSSLTRTALRAGAAYLSDDLVILSSAAAYGFARAIRFSEVNARPDPMPDYLKDTVLESCGRDDSTGRFTPIWWQHGPVCRALPLPQERVAVVTLSRGEDTITPLTEVERLVALHESAIIKAGEYNGALGAGPGFALSWQDPDRAFSLLAEQLLSFTR